MGWILSATTLEGTKGKGEVFVEKAFDFRHVEFDLSVGICRGLSRSFICDSKIQKEGDLEGIWASSVYSESHGVA